MEQVSYLYNERRLVSDFLCSWLEIKFVHFLLFGVNECVVWFLALPASIEAATLVREVSRLQTVQAQAIRLNGGNHLVMWQ